MEESLGVSWMFKETDQFGESLGESLGRQCLIRILVERDQSEAASSWAPMHYVINP